MPESARAKFTVEVNRIEQKKMYVDREYTNQPTPSNGAATVHFQLEEVAGEEFSRDVSCRVELKNAEGATLFTAVSEYRVGHEVEIEGDFPTRDIAETLSELALRVSYPYHRFAISNAVSMSGLPTFFLPLAADSEWITVVKETRAAAVASTQEGSDDSAPDS